MTCVSKLMFAKVENASGKQMPRSTFSIPVKTLVESQWPEFYCFFRYNRLYSFSASAIFPATTFSLALSR